MLTYLLLIRSRGTNTYPSLRLCSLAVQGSIGRLVEESLDGVRVP